LVEVALEEALPEVALAVAALVAASAEVVLVVVVPVADGDDLMRE
jgi:hypothetical protein